MIRRSLLLSAVAVLTLAACGQGADKKAGGEGAPLLVGATAVPHAEILEVVKPILAAEGVPIEIKVFNDYVQPNVQLSEKRLDVNYFQTKPYLDEFNIARGADLVTVVGVHVEPLGIYSKKHTALAAIPNGAQAVTQTVTAGANGSWSFNFPAGTLVGGERTATITATSTDAAGNVTNTAYSFKVDTLVNPLTQSGTIAGDGVINAAEAAAGVAIGGKVEAGAQSVILTLSNGKVIHAAVSGDSWTAHLSASDLSQGHLTYTVRAVDAAGNVGTIGDNGALGFTVDTVAPTGLEVVNISKSNSVANTLEMVKTAAGSEQVTLHRVDATGDASDVAYTKDGSWLDFSGHGIPDGSYLVIENADAAGNSTSTLLVVNNTTSGTIDLSREGLDGFDLGIIDLLSAPQANLTITSADLDRLTGVDQTLVIRGGADDHVTLDGATRHAAADTKGYLAYQLGDGIVLIDDDINNVTTII